MNLVEKNGITTLSTPTSNPKYQFHVQSYYSSGGAHWIWVSYTLIKSEEKSDPFAGVCFVQEKGSKKWKATLSIHAFDESKVMFIPGSGVD